MKKGRIIIRLEQVLKEKGMSKTKFSQRAEVQMTHLNRYLSNDVALLSVDVLARMCSALDCDISDILVYEEIKED